MPCNANWMPRRPSASERDAAIALAAEATRISEGLRNRLDELQAAAQAAHARADTLAREEAARRGRGLLARLRAALRGG